MNYLSQVVNAVKRGDSIPTEPQWVKWIHRNLSPNHCSECLKLHNCWFSKESHPKHPHHTYCHCILEDIPYVNVMFNGTANCPYSKFDPYLFNTEKQYSHTKEKMFNSWGYTVADAKWLQNEVKKQALEKYINGEYQLGLLNKYGQRISIRVEIPNKTKGEFVSFITGWTVYPNGHISLNTPYGGK